MRVFSLRNSRYATGLSDIEFYYGLCEIVIVLTLYWRSYVLQNCYLRGEKENCMTLILMIKILCILSGLFNEFSVA